MRALLLSCLLAALPATGSAEEPISAAEFEAYATGKTLSYAVGGQVYGAEQYLPGRRVLWAFKGEECNYGRWYEEDGKVCFVYEHDATPQCWTFYRGAEGLRARFGDDPEGTELSEVAQSKAPLICAGPDVGV
ncbi:hypothetical protein FAZ78_25265 [Cereibacter changlensis]|uniref:DUF995 domain-containing protein n=1 Tax=Cereibacter changlensis TaxID=402884 RepID=A0A4U0YTV5_9RHOB|nr:hypothetical protein [Cereibacter changlensis]TKA93916.1 hypothetical protein FAZ78_25265 [Cereibacter changlensis]